MVILLTRNVKKGLIQEDFKITLRQASAIWIFIHCHVLQVEGTWIMIVEGFSLYAKLPNVIKLYFSKAAWKSFFFF